MISYLLNMLTNFIIFLLKTLPNVYVFKYEMTIKLFSPFQKFTTIQCNTTYNTHCFNLINRILVKTISLSFGSVKCLDLEKDKYVWFIGCRWHIMQFHCMQRMFSGIRLFFVKQAATKYEWNYIMRRIHFRKHNFRHFSMIE